MRPSRPFFFRPDGTRLTLDSGRQAFEKLRSGNTGTLFLGLGPDMQGPAALACPDKPVFWTEHPDFAARVKGVAPPSPPENWKYVDTDDIAALPPDCAVFCYRLNMQLFPEFWGPLRAGITARSLNPGTRTRSLLLPGDAHSLLTKELETAFADEGFAVRRVDPAHMLKNLPALPAGELPALCLSVNLRGLDAGGENFYLLRACGVPTAIWLVDNPWHILSALRGNWWREAHLYVTDASFLPALRAAGASKVFHLPLASWMKPPLDDAPLRLAPLLFVGRSAFPGKRGFFAAERAPVKLLAEARTLLETGGKIPDFHWWVRKLGQSPPAGTRAAGLGAEESSLARRALWLRAALPHGLTVYGDENWRELLPSADLRPPVDYYTTLPRLYAAARYSLNVTSLLLPAGLTQRHFDVWSAGGFLITDATPGLEIFPPELTREISLRLPSELAPLLRRLENEPALRADLRQAWKTLLAEQHTYRQRVRHICETIF